MSRTIVKQLCAGIALTVLPAALSAEDAAEPVIVPVKVLSSASPSYESPEMGAMMAAPDRPQPTLPGGKLPQYQVGQASRESLSAEELDDARLRFILALPAQPVLVEAEVTIDGRPFRMAREQRIAEILEALRQPPADAEAVSSTTSDDPNAPAEAGTESEVSDSGNQTEPAESEGDDEAVEPAGEEEAEPEGEVGEPEPEPVNPPTVAEYSLASSATEYVRRYAAASGQEPSVDEIRWLLANWSEGPVLLMLQENFQRFRARERPVFDVLDRDRDGTVAADELELAVQSFNECDLNRDDVVDATEIAAAANDPRVRETTSGASGPLIFAIPDEVSATSTYQRLAARYGTTVLPRFDDNVDGRFDAEELSALETGEPDVTLTIAFSTSDSSASTISVTAVRAAHGSPVDSTISLPLAGATVVFSAVQGSGSDQVSLGAVVDGYPILPEIDPNDDGRFTIRELRGLVEDLKRLDRNGDGRLTSDEAQPPVRVCFGLGPVVHRELAGIRSVSRGPASAIVEGPDWFVRMDRNRDRDLTRGEFPGTDEQFALLDADSDELVSAAEALEFDQKSRGTENGAESPETETVPESETEE